MNTENPTVTLRSLESSRGVAWLTDGWNVFKRNPGVWVLITLVIIVLNVLIGMLPMVGLLTNLFMPVIAGGLMLACKRVDDGGEIEVGVLFDGFRSPAFSKLVMLGVVSLLGAVAIAIIIGVSVMTGLGSGMMMGAGHHGIIWPALGLGSMVGCLLALALVIPLTMALWFAPALVVLRNMEPMDAVRQSFDGCMKNMWPMTVYSLVALLLLLVAFIPLGLGLLVALPVLVASVYCGYKDIYL